MLDVTSESDEARVDNCELEVVNNGADPVREERELLLELVLDAVGERDEVDVVEYSAAQARARSLAHSRTGARPRVMVVMSEEEDARVGAL